MYAKVKTAFQRKTNLKHFLQMYIHCWKKNWNIKIFLKFEHLIIIAHKCHVLLFTGASDSAKCSF